MKPMLFGLCLMTIGLSTSYAAAEEVKGESKRQDDLIKRNAEARKRENDRIVAANKERDRQRREQDKKDGKKYEPTRHVHDFSTDGTCMCGVRG